MTTHTHFIVGSYAVFAVAIIIEIFLVRRQAKQARKAAQTYTHHQ
jgi:heme exporter protein CcmD